MAEMTHSIAPSSSFAGRYLHRNPGPSLRHFLGIALLGLGGIDFSVSLRAESPEAKATTFFETKIRPLLSEQCFECHNHQAKKIKGGLVLDSREGALNGGDNGPALVPGAPDK